MCSPHKTKMTEDCSAVTCFGGHVDLDSLRAARTFRETSEESHERHESSKSRQTDGFIVSFSAFV